MSRWIMYAIILHGGRVTQKVDNFKLFAYFFNIVDSEGAIQYLTLAYITTNSCYCCQRKPTIVDTNIKFVTSFRGRKSVCRIWGHAYIFHVYHNLSWRDLTFVLKWNTMYSIAHFNNFRQRSKILVINFVFYINQFCGKIYEFLKKFQMILLNPVYRKTHLIVFDLNNLPHSDWEYICKITKCCNVMWVRSTCYVRPLHCCAFRISWLI